MCVISQPVSAETWHCTRSLIGPAAEETLRRQGAELRLTANHKEGIGEITPYGLQPTTTAFYVLNEGHEKGDLLWIWNDSENRYYRLSFKIRAHYKRSTKDLKIVTAPGMHHQFEDPDDPDARVFTFPFTCYELDE